MQKHNIFLLTLLLAVLQFSAFAQTPVPAAKQTERIILLGGKAFLGNGEVIENSAIGFEDGKITFVADAGIIKIDPTSARIINIQGKHVYPALIAANSTLGLAEIDAIRASRDFREVGEFNPNARAAIAYNTDSRIIPTIRSNGILLAHVVPQGGRVTGCSSIMQLDGWNWEDAAYSLDNGIHVNWPSLYTWKGWWADPGGIEPNKDYQKQVQELYDYFSEASAYKGSEKPSAINLRFKAMSGLFDKSKKLFINVNGAREIRAALDFARQFDLNTVIVGGKDAWMVADMLRDQKVPVILNSIHSLPSRTEDDIDLSFKIPKLLADSGVVFAIGMAGTWQQRNLPFLAGTAIAHGLSPEDALKSITSNVAEILGIADRTGTLEAGKDANIIISDGDIFDMRTHNIIHAFLQGREIDLDNHQKQLYDRFKTKYGLE